MCKLNAVNHPTNQPCLFFFFTALFRKKNTLAICDGIMTYIRPQKTTNVSFGSIEVELAGSDCAFCVPNQRMV